MLEADLTGVQIRVYGILMKYMNKSGHAWPSTETIACHLDVSRQAVGKALSALKDKNFIRYAGWSDYGTAIYMMLDVSNISPRDVKTCQVVRKEVRGDTRKSRAKIADLAS